MLFNSYVFIFAFLPVVLCGFYFLRRLPDVRFALTWLVLASLFYYAWWKFEFLALLFTSILVNLGFGLLLLSNRIGRPAAKVALTLGVVFNLGLLGYFKYADFFVTNVNSIFGAGWGLPQVLLPIGISFITFQKIAFLVDAYRGEVTSFSVLNYSFFVTFFPQLIAGPIVHHAEIMPQLGGITRRPFATDFSIGASIFIVGLFKKVVIADSLAVYADAGYGMLRAGEPLDFASAWMTVLCYSLQLYYDFSGYSEMALGIARMFSIKLPVNFFSPYKSASIIEFWRRWHMTLSRFLRDYLYFPLGGNRKGVVRRYFNLIIVMVLGGLWHGANWTFVVWGAVHGLMLAINHGWNALAISRSRVLNSPPARWVGVGITFLAVTLAWVPFRSASVADAGRMMGYLFPTGGGMRASIAQAAGNQFALSNLLAVGTWFRPRELWPPNLPPHYIATHTVLAGLLLLAVLAWTFAGPNTLRLFGRFAPALGTEKWVEGGIIRYLGWGAAMLFGAMFVLSILSLSRVSPFLYFQF